MHIWLISHIIKINLIACRLQGAKAKSRIAYACGGKKKRKEEGMI